MSLKIAVAAPFKHMRKERLQKSEFIFYLAIDRKWMSKSQAQELHDRAVAEGLIGVEGGWITPHFDLETVTVPLGFKPSSEIFKKTDPLPELIERIVSATGRPQSEIVAELNAVIEESFNGNIRAETAAVLLAKQYGVPFEDTLDALIGQVLGEKKKG